MLDVLKTVLDVLQDALMFLRNYAFYPEDGETFSLMRVLSLFIAFSISGAIVVFLSQNAVLKFFGPKSKKWLSYFVASVSGFVLAVCSCSVLPMFASIRKKGAGLGPAVAFLFSGPAINILAIFLTFTDLGADIAFVRILSAIVLANVIGFAMFMVYRKSEALDEDEQAFALPEDASNLKVWQRALFFLTLLLILVFSVYWLLPTVIFAALLLAQIVLYFSLDDLKEWGEATWDLVKKIIPLFLIGVFIVGILDSVLRDEFVVSLVGENNYLTNLLAAFFGTTMYFATLSEVPFLLSMLDLGMHKGPATALLLAGPTLSVPNMIVIAKVLGKKKTLTYVVLVAVFAAFVGLIAGAYIYQG